MSQARHHEREAAAAVRDGDERRARFHASEADRHHARVLGFHETAARRAEANGEYEKAAKHARRADVRRHKRAWFRQKHERLVRKQREKGRQR